MQYSLKEKFDNSHRQDEQTPQQRLGNLVKFIDKTKRSIMLSHNQSLEVLRQRSVIMYEKLSESINSKLEVHQLNTHTLKINRKNQSAALDSLKDQCINMLEIYKTVPEVIRVERETAQRLYELREFKKVELASLWGGQCTYEDKLQEVIKQTAETELKRRDKKAQQKATMQQSNLL